MHVGRRYRLLQTLNWSRSNILIPFVWSLAVTAAFDRLSLHWLAIPWLPISLLGVAVAFYLGFKNNASYDRLWEARKIWGAIVNASRSWAMGARDLVARYPGAGEVSEEELERVRGELVVRHVAWLDALRHQLRRLTTWEHGSDHFKRIREASAVPEYREDLRALLATHVGQSEAEGVLSQINPAAHLLSNQSKQLARCRHEGWLDGFGHMELQRLLTELMAQQGKAERIKNFPFPRQYATVNSIFAWLFTLLVPFGMLAEFHKVGEGFVWLTAPFAALVGWVFLTADQIGEWSENPFEGLANDVPISTMSRAIERDISQMIGASELPPARELDGMIQF